MIDTHNLSGGQTPVSDEAWVDVLRAVDKTYAELVSYQSELEVRNAELDEMRGFMASVFASVSDVLIVVDRDGLIEQAAGSFQMLLGLDPASVRGRPLADLTSDAALHEAVQKVVQSRKSVRFETELPTSAGPTPIDLSITPRIGERGKSLGAVLIGRPVGELRQAYSELAESHRALQEAQAHLVRNEKLASLGRLLAGVAHELNNPISFIYANTHALEKYVARFVTYFEQVQAGASRAELIELRKELRLDRDSYKAFDAEEKFGIGYAAGPRVVQEPEGCECGAVMTGRMKPTACPQFGKGCTPEMPLGALMVSSEGACAAYWQYGGRRAAEAAE